MSTSEEVRKLYDRYVLGTYAPELVLVRGEGAYVYDAEGRRYLDFAAGIAVCGLGHAHPAVVRAIREQAGRLMHVSNLYYNEPQARLAERLVGAAFDGRCFFANSGAEANEGMVKFARAWGRDRGRYRVVCVEGSFHGRTLAMIAATGQEKVRRGFDPLPDGFVHAPFGDLAALEAAIDERTAAVLVEPILGEGGVRIPPAGYLKGLRELCDRAGVLLLLDEVQTGMGRTGLFFAHQGEGIVPDAMSVAKGLGNGFPIGGFVVRRRWEGVLPVGSHASTFGGNPLAGAAALAVVETIAAPGFLENVRAIGEFLLDRLRDRLGGNERVRGIRGRGLMIGIELDEPSPPICRRLASDGLLVIPAGANVLRLVPPLIIDREQAAEACDRIAAVLAGPREENR